MPARAVVGAGRRCAGAGRNGANARLAARGRTVLGVADVYWPKQAVVGLNIWRPAGSAATAKKKAAKQGGLFSMCGGLVAPSSTPSGALVQPAMTFTDATMASTNAAGATLDTAATRRGDRATVQGGRKQQRYRRRRNHRELPAAFEKCAAIRIGLIFTVGKFRHPLTPIELIERGSKEIPPDRSSLNGGIGPPGTSRPGC